MNIDSTVRLEHPPDLELGQALADLARDQGQWSQATFGRDDELGPMGTLRHLAKEAGEAQEALDRLNRFAVQEDAAAAESAAADFRVELADCLLLVLDASRRAGLTPLQLVREAKAKMAVNRRRRWPRSVEDQPTEHLD